MNDRGIKPGFSLSPAKRANHFTIYIPRMILIGDLNIRFRNSEAAEMWWESEA